MDPQFYREYYSLERESWWFKARLNILENTVRRKIQTNPSIKILNVGVATGATTEMLQKYGEVVSVEYDEDCCKFLKEKTGIEAICASLTDLPFDADSFDLVCAFDVIEHIEEDYLAIQEVHRVLKSGGNYFFTVPAFQFLWSNHDVVNHHFRRYTQPQLNKLIEQSKLQVSYTTYFNFWLFFPIALTRFFLNLLPRKKGTSSSGSDNDLVSTDSLINKVLYTIFNSENFLLKRGIRFPLGVSILSLGSK